MGPKIPVRPDNKKVNVLYLGFASLLKKHKANNVRDGEKVAQKLEQEEKISGEGKEVLTLQGIPEPSHFGGSRIQVSRVV